MTARIIIFRSGRTVTLGHVAILSEVLTRDGCRCAHCRAPGGAEVIYGSVGPRDVYVVLDTLEAFCVVSGEAQGMVPADTIPAWHIVARRAGCGLPGR
jgi:hypothetical protein